MKEEKKVAKKSDDKIKLVKMSKGDKVAEVHPDEVENYKAGGYK